MREELIILGALNASEVPLPSGFTNAPNLENAPPSPISGTHPIEAISIFKAPCSRACNTAIQLDFQAQVLHTNQ